MPNLDKVDLPRLVSDIPKYYNAGLFPCEVKAWWSADFETSYGTAPESQPAWPLDIFRSIISECPVEPTPIVQVSEVISPLYIPNRWLR